MCIFTVAENIHDDYCRPGTFGKGAVQPFEYFCLNILSLITFNLNRYQIVSHRRQEGQCRECKEKAGEKKSRRAASIFRAHHIVLP